MGTPAPPSITAVVLVGGRARRLGGIDKAALSVPSPSKPQTFLEHILAELKSADLPILLAGRANQTNPAPPHPFIQDNYPNTGPLGALTTAMENASTEWVFIVACDLPAFSATVVQRLLALRQNHPSATSLIPKTNEHLEVTAALYHRSHLSALQGELAKGNYSLKRWIHSLDSSNVAIWDTSDDEAQWFRNVNSPEDLRQLQGKPAKTP